MPLNKVEPKGFDNHSYLTSIEVSGVNAINTQLNILKNNYCKSKFYKGIERKHLDYQVEYLEYLKFWHDVK